MRDKPVEAMSEVLNTGVRLAARPPFFYSHLHQTCVISYMKTVTITCEHCGKIFERYSKEHKRNLKKGRRVFCNISCKASWFGENEPSNPLGNPRNLKRGMDKDGLSPYRWYIKVTKQRKKFENNLTLEFLKELWDKQGGTCPYTRLEMVLEEGTGMNHGSLLHASLDRIDSSKGYVQGNVEFVCSFINYAKNKFSREEVEEVLKKIRAKNSS